MAEEEIKDETGAALVKRIQKRDQSGMLIPTMTVMLAYNHEDEVPDKVQLRWLKFKTRPYIPLVMRCFRCQGYGHVARPCYKPNDVCPACAGSHKFDACPTKDQKKYANCRGDHGSGFKDCSKYFEAKAVVRRAAEENTSYRDPLINMRKDERKDKKRSSAQDLPSGTRSTSTAPGQSTLDDDAWPTITDNTDNTRQHRNMSCLSVARTVQSNRKSIAIQVDIDDDCQKSTERDDSSQYPSTAAARDRSRDRPRDRPRD